MALELRQYTSTRLSVADEARLGRLDQLLASPELRQRFGARALNGSSAILAALAWINQGDGEGEHGAPASVVRWPAAGNVGDHVDEAVQKLGAESAQALPLEGKPGPLDDGDDRQRQSSVATAITEEA